MKKILFLEQFSNISGGQRVLLNTLTALDRSQYDPYVCMPAKGELSKELDGLGIKYFILPIGRYSAGRKNILDLVLYLMRSIYLVPLTIGIIRQNKIALVYANAPRTFFFGTIAARLSGVPIIWHLHSILSGLELRLSYVLLKSMVSKMIAVSNAVAEPFIKKDRALAEKIEIVYNGIDSGKYAITGAKADIRKELGIDVSTKLAAYIGQIARWKGIEDFIKAADIILKQKPDVRFIVVGDVLFGEEKGKGYKHHLTELVNELGLSRSLTFTGRRNDIPRVLSAIDVLAIPSILPDPCPLILLEAMASGAPVVASSHGGPGEIIRDGIDGMLYRPGDHARLANAMIKILNDNQLAHNMGEAAHHRAVSDLSFERYMSTVSGLIDKILMS